MLKHKTGSIKGIKTSTHPKLRHRDGERTPSFLPHTNEGRRRPKKKLKKAKKVKMQNQKKV